MSELNINVDAITNFLTDLLAIHSPTGFTADAVAFVQDAYTDLKLPGFDTDVTPKGALVSTWQGAKDDAPVGVTAHVDTLGLMVKEIKSNGALKVFRIGGLSWNGAEFENVTIRTFDNRRYRGTLILSNPSSHVNREVATKKRDADSMEVRIDAKTTSADETRALGIEVGDFVFLDPRIEVTDTGFIRSRFLDNKAGVACIYGALLALKDAGLKPAQDTTILTANYEEVGHGGSTGFPDDIVELLTIDMGALGDGQNGDEFSVSVCTMDGGGPYHFEMTNKLRRLAEANDVPYKPDIYQYYSSDGTQYWSAGGAARVALIGPGVASSHGYERTHKEALSHTAHLIARYLLDYTAGKELS